MSSTTVQPGPLVRGLGRVRLALIGAVGVVLSGITAALTDNVITPEETTGLVVTAAGAVGVWAVPVVPRGGAALKAGTLAVSAVAAAWLGYAADGWQAGDVTALLWIALSAAGILTVDNDPPAAAR